MPTVETEFQRLIGEASVPGIARSTQPWADRQIGADYVKPQFVQVFDEACAFQVHTPHTASLRPSWTIFCLEWTLNCLI